jgi:hypothetical protein
MILTILAVQFAYSLGPSVFVFFVMYLLLRRHLNIAPGKMRVLRMFLATWTSISLINAIWGIKAVELQFHPIGNLGLTFVVSAIALLLSMRRTGPAPITEIYQSESRAA